MWYGILIALSGGLGGAVVAMYYRVKYADQRAEIVGLRADVKTLGRDIEDRDKALAADLVALKKQEADHVDALARKDQLIKDKDRDLTQLRAALKVLRARDPAGVAASLGSLFPAADKDGGQGGAGGAGGGGAGRP